MTSREVTVSDTGQTVSMAIVDAIADMEGTTASAVEPPLYEAVDPDALDRIFAPTDRDEPIIGYVRFEYGGYDVSVSSAGLVRIRDAAGVGTDGVDETDPSDPGSDGVDEAL